MLVGAVGVMVEGSGDLTTTEIRTYRKALVDSIRGVAVVSPGRKKVSDKTEDI